MKKHATLLLLVLMATTLAFTQTQSFLIPYQSSWKYLDNGTNQGSAWRGVSFNDAAWQTGTGKFGYGVSGITTPISYGPNKHNKYITTYFRKTFTIANPNDYLLYLAEITNTKKNGMVVYVNGVEVYRHDMPHGNINYTTEASNKNSLFDWINIFNLGQGHNSGHGQEEKKVFLLNRTAFKAGTNVIAVEVHLEKRNAHAMVFDMKLIGYPSLVNESAPTVQSISRQVPSSQVTSANSLVFRVKFSEKVRGVSSSDFILNVLNGSVNGYISSVNSVGSDGSTYDVRVSSVSGSGTLRLDLKSSGTNIRDTKGNAIKTGFTSGQTYIVDNIRPVVSSMKRYDPLVQVTSQTTVTFRTIFSEAVSGVGVSDFFLSGPAAGIISAVTPVGSDGHTYDVKVSSITGTGTLKLNLKAFGTGIEDKAGNRLIGGFEGESYTISTADVTSPFVSSINRHTPSTQNTTLPSVTFAVTFSEPVTGVDGSDFVLSTLSGNTVGTIGAVNGTGANYMITVNNVAGAGTIRLDLKSTGTGIMDAANNAIAGGFTSGQTYIISLADITAPVVNSINRHTPSGQNTSLASVIFAVTFSEPVTGVNSADFALIITGTATGNISGISGSGANYLVTVSGITGIGTVQLNLKDAGTGITDAAGNPINGGFVGQAYNVSPADVTAPAVQSILRENPATQNTTATTVTFAVNFSEPVTGLDASDFALFTTGGTVSGTIGAPVGSGASYKVTVSGITGTGPLRLDLKSGNLGIMDAAGNAFTSGYTSGQSYNISIADLTPPVVNNIERLNPLTPNTTLNTVTFKVTFSEPVTGVNDADFLLNTTGGTVAGLISSVSGSGNVYSVTISNITGAGPLRLDLKASGTGIVDAAGNAIGGGFITGETYTISVPLVYGFNAMRSLNPVPIGNTDTQHKPQGKTWKYNNKWWSVIPVSDGTKIFRLDGTTWTPVTTLVSVGGRADCWVDNNLVHILIHRNTLTSYIVSVQHDAATNTYVPWVQRPSPATIVFPQGTETATLTVDGTDKMWIASTGTTEAYVWWSSGNYSSWSGPFAVATGINDDDICTITKLQGKVGFMWSNHNTGLFGFKTHTDGAPETSWSADEVPASQSVIPGNPMMADDHLNVVATSDGTLYCAVKTSYSGNNNLPLVSLLVRRPSGTWDNLYPVATVGEDGTQPIVIVNEIMGKVKVVYTTVTNGGDIVYKESRLSSISFGAELPLISTGSPIYNFASSTHQTYNPEVVIIATKITDPRAVVSVMASDAELPGVANPSFTSNGMPSIEAETLKTKVEASSVQVYPTVVRRGERIRVQVPGNAVVEMMVADATGRIIHTDRFAGNTYIETGKMAVGKHFLVLKNNGKAETKQFMIAN